MVAAIRFGSGRPVFGVTAGVDGPLIAAMMKKADISRSGGTGRRASFRSWFPYREWRFKSSLRHVYRATTYVNNVVVALFVARLLGEYLVKELG